MGSDQIVSTQQTSGGRILKSRMASLPVLSMVLPLLAPSCLSQLTSNNLQGNRSCINSCCMSCTPDTCDTCYRLNPNPVMCPCMEDRVETNSITTPSTINKAEPGIITRLDESKATVLSVKHFKRKKQRKKIKNEGQTCLPSCCPSTQCTKITCPICFYKSRTRPRECPCAGLVLE